ncbi:hypothetical protein RFI_26513, partial [Reticulomyxa filosa]
MVCSSELFFLKMEGERSERGFGTFSFAKKKKSIKPLLKVFQISDTLSLHPKKKKKKGNMTAHSTKEKDDTSTLLNECYDTNWLLDNSPSAQERNKENMCCICHKLANNAMEFCCEEHENDDEAFVVGESCLLRYLKENNSKCPIGDHSCCEYQKSFSVRKQVSKLEIRCPRQCQRDLANPSVASTKAAPQTRLFHNMMGSDRTGLRKSVSGITGAASLSDMNKDCTFRGRIKDLELHLLKECSLNNKSKVESNRSKCEFHEFGCLDTIDSLHSSSHYQTYVSNHLQLVLAEVRRLQQQQQQQQQPTNTTGSNSNSSEEVKKLQRVIQAKDKKIEQLNQTITELTEKIEHLQNDLSNQQKEGENADYYYNSHTNTNPNPSASFNSVNKHNNSIITIPLEGKRKK